VTYFDFGVNNDDLKQIVENEAKKHIDTAKQAIQSDGLEQAVLRVTNNKTANGVQFELQSVVQAGVQPDANGIKKEIAGKKKGDAVNIIQSRPGVKEVTIKYSPFWVSSTPKQASHITITFQQSNGSP
jgi:hypothetical protein